MNSKSTQQTALITQCKGLPPAVSNLSKVIVTGGGELVALEVSITTVAQTLGKPTLRASYKGADAVAYGVINQLVQRFLKAFGFSKQPDPALVEMLTVDTLEHFAYESLEDVVLFFKMARSGKFGTATRGIDSNLIFSEWLPKYLEQKAEARELDYQEKKALAHKDEKHFHSTEEVLNHYQKLTAEKQMEKKMQRAQTYVDDLTKDFDRQLLEDTITHWQKQGKPRLYLDLLKQKRKTIK